MSHVLGVTGDFALKPQSEWYDIVSCHSIPLNSPILQSKSQSETSTVMLAVSEKSCSPSGCGNYGIKYVTKFIHEDFPRIFPLVSTKELEGRERQWYSLFQFDQRNVSLVFKHFGIKRMKRSPSQKIVKTLSIMNCFLILTLIST